MYWLAKVRADGESAAVGTPTPVPVRVTVWVPPVELLSTIVMVPVAGPAAVGEKVTVTVQVAPGASVAPHVLETRVKGAPLAAMAEMFSVPLPELVSVMVCGVVVEPTF